ncbi:MAG: glutaminyl-peptide cyclotransferase [Bryobacteraceae bacterium]
MRTLCLILTAAAVLTAADRKRVIAMPKAGVTTPGVQIPMSKLKPEAEIAVPGATAILGIPEAVWVGTLAGIVPIDTKLNKAGDRIAAVKAPCAGLATGFDGTWIADCGNKSIARLQAKTNESKAVIASGAAAALQGIAATGDSIWALTDEKGTLSRIDPASGKVVAETRLPAGCTSMVSAEKSLWVTCASTHQLLRIDPLTNLVEKYIDVAAEPRSLVFAEGSIWVLGSEKGKVSRVDPKTNKVTATIELQIPNGKGEITAGAGSVWVTAKGFPITRIDPKTDQVVQQFAGDGGGALRFGANSLWLVNIAQQTVWRVDPKRVLATFAE